VRRVADPHWRNLIPDEGSLLPVGGRQRQYKLTDGRLMTMDEILNSTENVHGISPVLLCRRVRDDHMRDPADIYSVMHSTKGRNSK